MNRLSPHQALESVRDVPGFSGLFDVICDQVLEPNVAPEEALRRWAEEERILGSDYGYADEDISEFNSDAFLAALELRASASELTGALYE